MDFDFSTGVLALDFVNTWENREDPSTDRLHSYQDLLEWARQSRSLDEPIRRQLMDKATRHPRIASNAYSRAISLRDMTFRICSARVDGVSSSAKDVRDFNAWLGSIPRPQLRIGGDCCIWERPVSGSDLHEVVWPVVLSAASLFTSNEVCRLRQCAATDCSWLFLDTGRGPKRKWCDMKTCGNREKARRYYERHRRNI